MATKRDRVLQEIGRLLGQIERDDPRQRAAVDDIRKLIGEIGPRSKASAPRRTSDTTTYRIAGVGAQASLGEHRPAAQPLRVPRAMFNAIVAILADSDRPVPFDEIMRDAAKAQQPPAEWQARVVLRFLMRADPEILVRSRSRYQPNDSKHFLKLAEKWWKDTAASS